MSTITDLEQARAIFRQGKRAPVDAAGGVPKGVTVRQIGDPEPANHKPNLLERAAMCDSRDVAASALLTALQIDHDHVCTANLSDPDRWRQMPVEARLHELGSWMMAEAFECMDLVAFDKPAGMTIGD